MFFLLLQVLFIFQTLHILSLSYAGHLYALLSVEIQEKDNITRTAANGSYIKSKPNSPHFPIQHKSKKYIQRKSDKYDIDHRQNRSYILLPDTSYACL